MTWGKSEEMLWWCGDFLSLSDRTEVYLGDENSLSLTFNARNEGEGGAYEAELYVVLPPEADYSGIGRDNVVRTTWRLFKYKNLPCNVSRITNNNITGKEYMLLPFQSLTQLTCSYEAENQTRYLVCDLGNPMKPGTSVRVNRTHVQNRTVFDRLQFVASQ